MNRQIISIRKKYRSYGFIVSLDNDEELVFSTDIIVKYKLSEKSILTNDLLEKILTEQRIFDLKRSAYSYASYKPRTEKQVRQKLESLGYDSGEIEFGLKFLKEFNFLNDADYANQLTKEMLRKSVSGKKKMYAELINRGIEKNTASKTVETYFDDNNEEDIAMFAAKKKLSRISYKPVEKQKNSVFSYMQRQGFDYGIIKKVMKQIFNDDIQSL
jgi:regulatory protein